MAINAGMNPNEKKQSEEDKDRLVQLRAAVDARLSLEARTKGRPLSPEERVRFAQQAFDDTVRIPGWFGRSTEMPASALTKAERDRAVVVLPRGSVRIKDIPAEFVDQAETALRNAGRPVTQKGVAEMWQLNRGTWGRPQTSNVDRIPK